MHAAQKKADRSRRRNALLAPRPSALDSRLRSLGLRALLALPLASAVAQDTQTEPSSNAPAAPTYAPVPTVQSAPASASGYVGMTPATSFGGTSQLAVGAPTTFESALAGIPNLFQWGPVSLHPHLSYDVSYGNGLQSSQGDRSSTLINTLSPGISFALKSHWFLDYTPSLRFYSSPQFKDGVDHLVVFNGGTTYHDWAFGLSQSYSSTSQPLVETGAQTGQQIYTTALSASHALNSKFSFDLTANQNLRYVSQGSVVQPLTDTRTWSTMEWLNYQIVPRLTAGLGAGFTYDNVSVGADMTSEQFQGRINWQATDKISLFLSGGLDDRQFLASAAPDLLSPVFAASIQYQIFEPTSLSLTASRSISPSYFQNAVTEGTSISAGLHQRLLKRLSLDVSGGYSTTKYHDTATFFTAANNSSYDVTSINVRLSTTFRTRATAAIYFQETFLASSSTTAIASLYNYTTTQYGLSLAYRF
jgi:hypothetical protein